MGKWQGPVPSPCATSPTEGCLSSQGRSNQEPSILWWVSRHFCLDLRDLSKQEFATLSMFYFISVMDDFYNGLRSFLLHTQRHSSSCSIWETQIIAKECSIFISVHNSMRKPTVMRSAETDLGIYLSHKWVTSTFYFVLCVGRSAVLGLYWEIEKLWLEQIHVKRVQLLEEEFKNINFYGLRWDVRKK